jgi:hypothetical protein
MMKTILFLLSALCSLWAVSSFTPSPAGITIKTARRATGLKPTHARQTILRMSEEKTETEEPATPAAPPKGQAFYDDEVSAIVGGVVVFRHVSSSHKFRTGPQYDSAPKKSGISDSMKARLLAEASTGLDSDKKQNNVLLYIIAAVAALVVLGGQGVFY